MATKLTLEDVTKYINSYDNGRQKMQEEKNKRTNAAPINQTIKRIPTLEETSRKSREAEEQRSALKVQAENKARQEATPNYDRIEEDRMRREASKRRIDNEMKQIEAMGMDASQTDLNRYNQLYNTAENRGFLGNNLSVNDVEIDRYLDPNYRMSKSEEQNAKTVVDNYFRKNPDAKKLLQMSTSNPYRASKLRAQMSDKKREEYDRITSLMNKTSNLSAYTYGLMNIVPFEETIMDKLGGDNDYNYSMQKQNVKTQSPLAFTGGDMTSKLAAYSVLGNALEGIPALGQATNELGQAMAFGNKAIGNSIGNILRGNIADIVLDTIPSEIENYRNGMSAKDIAIDALKNEAANTAFNAVGEIPALVKAFRGLKANKAENAYNANYVKQIEDLVANNTDDVVTAPKIADDVDIDNIEWGRGGDIPVKETPVVPTVAEPQSLIKEAPVEQIAKTEAPKTEAPVNSDNPVHNMDANRFMNDKKYRDSVIKKQMKWYENKGFDIDKDEVAYQLESAAKNKLAEAPAEVADVAKNAPVAETPKSRFFDKINTKGLQKNIKFDNDADNEAYQTARKAFLNAYQKHASNPTIDSIDDLVRKYQTMLDASKKGYMEDNSVRDTYRQIKRDFANRTKGMVIKLSDADLADLPDETITSLNKKLATLGNNTGIKFRKNSGTPIDTLWDDIVTASGNELNPDTLTTQEMVRSLVDYVDNLQAKVNNPTVDRVPADLSLFGVDEYLFDDAEDMIRKAMSNKVVAEDIGLNPNTMLDEELDIPNERMTDYGSIKYEEELPQGTGTVNERPEFDNPNPQFGVSDFYNNTLKNIVDEDNFAKYYDSADYLYEKGSHDQMMDNSYNILKKDFAGEYNRLLNTENFTAQDVATASMIRDFLSKSGHEEEAAEFANRIRPVMSTATAQALEAHKLFARSTPEGAVDEMLIQINKAIDKAKGDGYNLTVQRLGDKVSDAIKNEDDDLLVKILDDKLGANAVGRNNKVRYKNKEVKGKQEVLDFVETARAQKKSAAEIAEEAKKMLIKANGGADVSHEAESVMLDLAKQMEKLNPSSREYKELEAQMARYAQNYMPAFLGNKVKNILYTNMLGNLKTALTRNFGGNVVSQTVEKAQKPLRTLLDSALGKKTGVRNYTMGNFGEQAKAYGEGFKYGAVNQAKDLKTGLNTTRSGEEGLLNALDNNTKAWKYKNPMLDAKKWKSDASVTDKGRHAMNKISDTVMGVMGLGDRPIYEANFASAKAELNYILKKYGEDAIQTVGTTGKEASVGDLINFWAHQRALDSVFQQGSLTADGLSKIKKAVGQISKDQFGVDILSMPVSAFTQVPGNMISVGMDYSPAGIVKNAINTIAELKNGNFNQKRFVDQTSRNITGAGMLGGGVAAYQHGKITGPKSEDTDKNKAQNAANELEYALRLPGNTQVDISDIPYVGGTLQGAAEFAEALNEAKRGEISYPEAWSRGVGGAIEAQFGTSAMQGYNRILGANKTYNTSSRMVDNLKDTLGSSMSMFVPSLLRQTAAATDKYKRDLGKYGSFEYYLNNVKNSIPGLRETLPIKTTNQGVPYLQNQGRGLGWKLAENYILPYTISQPDNVYSDMDKVANSLYDELGTEANPAYTPGISRTTAKEWLGDNYSEDNYYLLKQNYGEYDSELGNAVIESDIFNQLSPEAQVRALNDVHTAAKELTNRDYGGAKNNQVADLYQNENTETAVESILYNSLFSEYGNDKIKAKYSEASKEYYETYGEEGLDALKKIIGSSTKQEQWLANLRDHSEELNLSDEQIESMIRTIKGDDLAEKVVNGDKTASEYYLGKAGDSSSTYDQEMTKEETTTRTGLNSNIPDSIEEMMMQADTSNRDGYPNAKEVQIYLDSLDLSKAEKAELYPKFFRNPPGKNPYR